MIAALFASLWMSPVVADEDPLRSPMPFPPGMADGSRDDEGVTLTWTAPESGMHPLDHYNIYRIRADQVPVVDEAAPIEVTPTDAAATSFLDSTADPDLDYIYFITAVSTEGIESIPSNLVQIHKEDYPRCTWFQYTIGPPPQYLIHEGCIIPPPE